MKILKVVIDYSENELSRITALVDFTPSDLKPGTDVRAIFASRQLCSGYMNIRPGMVISDKLIKQVIDTGRETVDRDDIFPNWKKTYFGK
jgi:hypothetical protein